MAQKLIGSVWQVGLVAGLLGASTALPAPATIKLADDRQVLAQADTTFSFDLAEVAPGKQVRLCLDARIEWGGLGGSTGAMSVTVNDQGLAGRHLVNKPLIFSMRNDEELSWGAETGNGYRLMYAPDFSDLIKTDEAYEYGIPDTDPFHFVWDITAYVRSGANSVRIASTPGVSFSLRLRDVAVEIGEPLPPRAAPAPPGQVAAEAAPNGPLSLYVPRKPAELPATIAVSASGDLHFSLGQREFTVRSRSSLPQGAWSGNPSAPANPAVLSRGKKVFISWTTDTYTFERQVTLHPDRIAVVDTFRNPGDALQGVIHEVRLELPERPNCTFLAGHVVKRLRQRSSPSHPTALAEYGDLALGLVAEDDVFRVHSKVAVEEGALVLADPQLGIAPGQEQRLEWSVYAVPDGDYWDVVNAIRRNWGSNVTLRGPSKWVHPAGVPTESEPIGQWRQGATMVVLCNPMFGTEQERLQGITIQHGTALPLCTAWCELAATTARGLQRATPSVEAFIYTHQNLCTEPGHEQKYPDSRAVDTTGKVATTVYSPSPSLFLPTLEDAYGKALMAVYQLIAERVDANVYIDEITASNVPAYGTYEGSWDGCTASVDPVSHAVMGKRSSAILLMQPWRAALLSYLTSKGKTVLANGPHYTRTMLSWPLQSFVESEPEDTVVVGAHLGQPLCIAQPYNPDAQARYRAACRLLDRAGIQFVTFAADISLFPITPIELRAGVIIGAERILTNRSGRFGWGDASSADVYVYDRQAKRVETPDAKEVRAAGEVMTELRLPADHLAILVRRKG
jgi:hypothetical protein